MPDLRHVKGLGDLERMLKQFPGELQEKGLVYATSQGAKEMQDEITARAPVRHDGKLKKFSKKSTKARLPGFLRALIRRRRVNKGSGTSVKFEVYVPQPGFYGRFLEFGTRHQAARPWFRPAIDASQGRVVPRMAAVLGPKLEQLARKYLKR